MTRFLLPSIKKQYDGILQAGFKPWKNKLQKNSFLVSILFLYAVMCAYLVDMVYDTELYIQEFKIVEMGSEAALTAIISYAVTMVTYIIQGVFYYLLVKLALEPKGNKAAFVFAMIEVVFSFISIVTRMSIGNILILLFEIFFIIGFPFLKVGNKTETNNVEDVIDEEKSS